MYNFIHFLKEGGFEGEIKSLPWDPYDFSHTLHYLI